MSTVDSDEALLTDLRCEVTALLEKSSKPPMLSTARGPDPRASYKVLGCHRLLAVDWPTHLGGRGLSAIAAAVVADEMNRQGIPDTLYVTTIQVAGKLLRAFGSEAQQKRLLPGMAAGKQFFCVLFSEPECGSDLSALSTSAQPDDEGHYRLDGCKVYAINADIADYGLLAARIEGSGGPQSRIGLFVLPMHQAGVSVEQIDTLSDEQFQKVWLDGVSLDEDTLVGRQGQGWAQIARAVACERTGLDYFGRARRWLHAAASTAATSDSEISDGMLAGFGRYAALSKAAGRLAFRIVQSSQAGEMDEVDCAISKYFSSELAREIAWWACDQYGLDTRKPDVALTDTQPSVFDSTYREAPAVTMSAGASELLLDVIANACLVGRS